MVDEKVGKPSRLWYLLPIFLNIVGGVIGYFLVKDRDRKFAERLLIVGLIMMVVWTVFSFFSSLLLSMWITSLVNSRTASIGTVTNQSQGQVTCSYGGLALSGVTYSNGMLNGKIQNIGLIKLEGLSLKITYKDASSETINLNTNLQSSESYQFSVSAKNNFDTIRVQTSNCPSVYDQLTSANVTKT